MEKTTICVECGHHEKDKGVSVVGGGSVVHHVCAADGTEKLNYVTGEKYTPRPGCYWQNPAGKCADWVPKKKENDDGRKED